jgi:hypothetical protein
MSKCDKVWPRICRAFNTSGQSSNPSVVEANDLPTGNSSWWTTSMCQRTRRLEAESIHIMREVAAECENPVMLYSVGKDSAVMLHLAMKAFYPSKPPFPLMHVDTTWKFREMIEFRDNKAPDGHGPDRPHQ